MKGFGLSAVVAAALLLALPAVASADILTVNDDDAPGDVGPGGTCGPRDHDSINDALSVVDGDDTVRVCAGTYEEFAHFATSEVTLLGAQAGVDARTRSVPGTEESVITALSGDGLVVNGSEGVIDGFTITGNTDGEGIEPGAEATIVNNIISGNDGGIVGDLFGGTIRRNRLIDNNVDENPSIGLGEASFSTIDDNLIEGESFASIFAGASDPAGLDVTITDNESAAGAGGIILFGGIGVQIARNSITTPPPGLAAGVTVVTSVDVNVNQNTVDNTGDAGAGVLLLGIDGSSEFVDITRNTLVGDGDEPGIVVADDSHDGVLDVHFNRIAGHGAGLVVADFHDVDATDNWWGCNEGPEFEDCDAIDFDNSFVDFDPWLTLSAAADPESISAGGATSQITADLLTNSDGDTVPADFPDGSQIDFATDLGTVDPLFDLTQGAVASTTLISGEETGTANVDSTLDNETVTTPVEITEESLPPPCTERIDGTAQNDNLSGTEGSELIRGRGGRDRVDGLAGDDCVKGGAGPDKVIGGADEDRVRGGAGDDKIKARDGESDVVRCGAGDDVAKVNPGDNVKGCEKVKRG